MSVAIHIQHALKKYGDNVIIPDLNLDIHEGEFFTLLGPSGCGKTTLLRMIAGFNSIEGGSFYFGDQMINDLDPAKRNIGMVFQNYAIFPHLTVRKNVEFGLKNKKFPKDRIREQSEKFMKLMQIADYADRMPDRLSGGQQQRVALARAIVIKPDVLLMDEPLSNLDAKLRISLRSELKRLQKNLGITTLYVTHDQDEAMVLGDKIVVMQGGVIHQADTPQNVWDNPATDFVAGFVGNSNKLKGKLNDGVLEIDGGTIAVSDLAPSSRQRLQDLKQADIRAFVRPETASLELNAATHDEAVLRVPVIVRDFHFMGSFVRISVELKSHTKLMKVNMTEVPAGLEPGNEATMVITGSDLMVFADKEEDQSK